MKITPLDIEQQTFQRMVRGYDTKQVDSFLELIRLEWESLLREMQQMHEEIYRKDETLTEFHEKEKNLRETLMLAQRMSSDVKQNAKKESDLIIGQAELQADKIIHQAHSRLTELIDEINELKRQRAEFEGRLSGILESHRRLLDLQKDARESTQIENLSILQTSNS